MLCARAIVVGSALWLANMSVSGFAAPQSHDIHFRAGYFATPVEIDGDIHGGRISSFEIICDSLDEDGGQGLLVIDQSDLKFNEFGDAKPLRAGESRKHRVSLERVKEKPRKNSPRFPIPNRAIYKLVFEDDFCDQVFFLNLSKDGVRPSRLVQCSPDDAPRLPRGGGPNIVRVYQLTPQGVQSKPRGDELIGDTISLHTPAIELVPGKTTGGIAIAGRLGGAGSLGNDPNRTGFGDYGDSRMQTLLGHSPSPIRLVENTVKDPQQLGRRVFDVLGRLITIGKQNPASPKVSYSVVVSPNISGEHRLIIRHDDVVAHVIPLADHHWQRYAAMLNSLTDEVSVRTITEIRKLIGNALSFGIDSGSVGSIRLTGDVSDELLQLVGKLENLSNLELSHCRGITKSGLEVIGQLKSLKTLSLRNTLVTDRALQLAGQLPQLSSFSIYHERKALTELNRITDAGVSHLANANQLKFLSLAGEGITDRAVPSLAGHNKLERLSFYKTSVTLGGLIELCGALPNCEINATSSKSAESFHNVDIAKGGARVAISGHVAEEDFVSLTRLMTLEKLSLPQSATDQTLKTVSKISTLETLRLQNNRQITNGGIEHLVALTELRELTLWYCHNLTDDCTKHVGQLKNLEKLNVGGTKLSNSAIDQLRSALPNCEIKR